MWNDNEDFDSYGSNPGSRSTFSKRANEIEDDCYSTISDSSNISLAESTRTMNLGPQRNSGMQQNHCASRASDNHSALRENYFQNGTLERDNSFDDRDVPERGVNFRNESYRQPHSQQFGKPTQSDFEQFPATYRPMTPTTSSTYQRSSSPHGQASAFSNNAAVGRVNGIAGWGTIKSAARPPQESPRYGYQSSSSHHQMPKNPENQRPKLRAHGVVDWDAIKTIEGPTSRFFGHQHSTSPNHPSSQRTGTTLRLNERLNSDSYAPRTTSRSTNWDGHELRSTWDGQPGRMSTDMASIGRECEVNGRDSVTYASRQNPDIPEGFGYQQTLSRNKESSFRSHATMTTSKRRPHVLEPNVIENGRGLSRSFGREPWAPRGAQFHENDSDVSSGSNFSVRDGSPRPNVNHGRNVSQRSEQRQYSSVNLKSSVAVNMALDEMITRNGIENPKTRQSPWPEETERIHTYPKGRSRQRLSRRDRYVLENGMKGSGGLSGSRKRARSYLKTIVVDGSGVGFSYGDNLHFDWKGIHLCVENLVDLGCEDITVIVPEERIQKRGMSKNENLINDLQKGHYLWASWEDRDDKLFVIKTAHVKDAVIISNDVWKRTTKEKNKLKYLQLQTVGFEFKPASERITFSKSLGGQTLHEMLLL